MNKRLKTAAGWLLCRSGLYRRMMKGRAVVVLFHRISDAHPNDPITVSTPDFERFVEFFGRFFNVISLTELLDCVPTGDLDGKLVITFDDGYRDNATRAAPILQKHGVRGCFFLATEYIGSNHIPQWDRERNIVSEWMTWNQARALREAGHDIGSHTQHHVDLGVVKGEEARAEIAGGKARLEAEIPETTGLFAHPFGNRGQMSDENNAVVKEIGLRCNLSAYGGTVRAGDDLYRLKRIPISAWFASPYQFVFELVTGKLETA